VLVGGVRQDTGSAQTRHCEGQAGVPQLRQICKGVHISAVIQVEENYSMASPGTRISRMGKQYCETFVTISDCQTLVTISWWNVDVRQ